MLYISFTFLDFYELTTFGKDTFTAEVLCCA